MKRTHIGGDGMSLCWINLQTLKGEREMKIILLQSVFPPADLPSYESPPSFLFLLFDVNFFMICAANLFQLPAHSKLLIFFRYNVRRKFYSICLFFLLLPPHERLVGKFCWKGWGRQKHIHKHWCDAVCSCRVQWTFLKQ